jgi:predicted DNA-binding ribbon-helix-helix protein
MILQATDRLTSGGGFLLRWCYSTLSNIRVRPNGKIARRRVMTSKITKRSIAIGGHETSVTLEHEFWRGVKEIASQRDLTLSQLVHEIGTGRSGNLSSAVRVYVLEHYQAEGLRRRAEVGIAPSVGK